MTSRSDIVAEARGYIGTAFRHQGRIKGIGVDCIGLVIGIANALGLSDYDITDYPVSPNSTMMAAKLREHLDEIAFKELLPGDIAWFKIVREPQHVAIITEVFPEMMMLHAYSKHPVSAVIEQPMGELWRRRIFGCYRFRGIE